VAGRLFSAAMSTDAQQASETPLPCLCQLCFAPGDNRLCRRDPELAAEVSSALLPLSEIFRRAAGVFVVQGEGRTARERAILEEAAKGLEAIAGDLDLE